jgi:two-component system response regulator QseB
MRLLLVEDDQLLGHTVQQALDAEGYAVDWLQDGSLVMAAVKAEDYDLVVLDRRLPGRSGIDILRSLRDDGIDTQVLMLTACDAIDERVSGLDAGADDYLTKPFDMNELFARIRSLLRRTGQKAPLLRAGNLELDPAGRRVVFEGEEIGDLQAKEIAVLEILMRNRGRFVTKARMLEGINSWGEEVESNTVEVYVSRLRKRFGRDSIETLRGVGYRMK